MFFEVIEYLVFAVSKDLFEQHIFGIDKETTWVTLRKINILKYICNIDF